MNDCGDRPAKEFSSLEQAIDCSKKHRRQASFYCGLVPNELILLEQQAKRIDDTATAEIFDENSKERTYLVRGSGWSVLVVAHKRQP